jgi:type I restriction enzyme S subunit
VTPLARSAAIAHGFGFQSRYFGRVRGYRLMTPGHFHEAGGFKDVGEKQKFYDGPVSDRYVLGKGDLIVAMTEQADGLLGSAALVPVGGVYLHNQRLGKVTTLSKDLSLGFLYRVFNSPTYRVKVRETAAGTKVKHTSPSKLLAIPVAIPPTKAEQEAIAVVLSDADALIESLEQLLAKKRHLKQGAMQELLTGKKRLPGHNRPWLAKRLGDLGSFSKGSGVSKGESKSGPLPCVRYGEIYTRHDAFIREFHSRISSGVAATATRLQRGDILFAGSGETKEEIGKCVAFVDQFEAYAGGDIVVLRTVDADPYFLGYYLNTAEINRQKASRGQGDAVVHIGAAALAQIRGWFPPPEEQAAIAEVFLDIDTEIDTLEAKLTKARQIKQGMMQELLTGRIRLV